MKLQQHIERLFQLNSTYLYADQAFNQASSLQTLSDDLYTDPFRFIYELIQNADDASSEHLQITLFNNNYLIIAHNGKPFDEKDIRSLCAVNNSTKIHNCQTAGYKGLGFKAIFGKSDYVLIINNGESFRFDKKFQFQWTWKDIDQTTWECINERKFIYPWQICPIWTENQEIPRSLHTWLSDNNNKMPVNIIIRLCNVNETRDALEELAIQPHTFLFLRHIRQIEFLGVSKPSTILIEQKPDGLMKLSYNKNQISQWLVTRREVLVPSEVLKDNRLPEKLRHVQSTEIGLAAKFNTKNNQKTFISDPNNTNVLFAYMPTKISTYRLPLLVTANFLTNANREQIHTDSIWNQWLFERIPRETIEWIKELIKKRNWGITAYDLLPVFTHIKDILADKYNESCSTALTNTKFIYNTHGEYLTVNEAIIDLTGLSNQSFIDENQVRQFILHHYNPRPKSLPLHPFISDNPRLRELGIRVFNWENAIEMFNSQEFQHSFSIDNDIQLISYLFNQTTDKEVSRYLNQIPYIMDRNKRLQTSTNIYFPSEFTDENWYSSDCPEAYIHGDLMRKLSSHQRQWLQQQGITVKTDLTYFYRTIIPQASTFITLDNALPTIQRLFHLYINGQIIADDLKKLENLSLLTNANTLVPANQLYLSSIYQPSLPLDTVLSKMPDLFVSSCYMQNISRIEWKYFFLLLGVHENINLIILNDNCRFFQNYHEDQMRIIFGLNSQRVRGYKSRITIKFLELTEYNYCFAHLFWNYVIKQIDVRCLNQSETAYWGMDNKPGAIYGSEVNTFPQWFVRTRSCIPVQILSANGIYEKQCLKGPDVFTNRLSPLIGHYLPIFECTSNTELLNDEWIKFFRFKTELSIDDDFSILSQIYTRNRDGIDIENDKRIQNIYGDILNKINANQRELYRDKCQTMNLCLLSLPDDLFLPPKELNFWSIDILPAPSQLNTFKLDRKYHQHFNLSHLLYILNINQITMEHLNLIPINDIPCDELSNRVQKSYLLLLCNFYKIKKKNLNQLDNIKFFEADRLELYINNPNVFVGNIQIYIKNNYFYITKPWNSTLILNELSKKLCEYLSLPIHRFETHMRNLLINTSIDDYLTQLGILHIDNRSSNDHGTKTIEQENLELFNQLKYLPSSYTPAQLLIDGLKAQNSSWSGYIYHYTHLENAISILRDQSLKSRHLCQINNFKDSSAYDFMSQTHDQINHYVRFYFRPRTLTQYNNENLGSEQSKKRNSYTPICPIPIFFRINLQTILDIPDIRWKVSLGDMSMNQTEYDCTLDVIQRFDFCNVFNNDFKTERSKHSIQLEFLIENQLDFRLLSNDAITLIYQNSDAKESLECILKNQNTHIYHSIIDKDYFFGNNNRIFINHDSQQDYISILIDGKKSHTNGMFIIQIKSNHNEQIFNLACKGNICATFYHDYITTIYGKEKQIDVFVGHRNYAVFYQSEQQLWLIYTNHDKYEFDDLHIKQYSKFIPYD